MLKTRLSVILWVLILSACSTSKLDRSPTIESPQPQLGAIDVAVVFDKTGSKAENKIPDLTIAQAKTLTQAVRKRGGEVRFLAICSDSDRPLLGVKFVIPATAPIAPAPLPAADTMNAFDYAQLEEKHMIEMAKYQQEKATFDRSQAAQLQQDNAQIEAFLNQLKPLLNRPASCRATDEIGAIQRVDLFLNERAAVGSKPARKVALFITDGEHNSRGIKQAPVFKSQPELIVVSGGKGAGIFEQLKPVKFESIDAAVADIVQR